MCDWPRCGYEVEVIYSVVRPPIELCDEHWTKLCELDAPSRLRAIQRVAPDAVFVEQKVVEKKVVERRAEVVVPPAPPAPPVPKPEVPQRRGPTQLMMFAT